MLPLVLALAFAAKVGWMTLHDRDGRASYDDARWGSARGAFAANTTLNVLEPWVAPYGEGTARYREGDVDGAVRALETALLDVPPAEECRVRINLSLAHEGVGDAARAGDDPAAARAAYRDGVVALADCLGLDEPETTAPDEARVADARAVDSRLRDKLAEARAAEEAAEQAPEDPAEAEQQDQLDERNQQGEDQRDKTEQRQQDEEQPEEQPEQPTEAPPIYAW